MKLTKDGMKDAGTIMNYTEFTNDELELAIEGTKLALAYLQGRGEMFWLASSQLEKDLSWLQISWDNRKGY